MSFTKESLEQLKKYFEEADTDKDGFINLDEFGVMIGKIPITAEEKEKLKEL